MGVAFSERCPKRGHLGGVAFDGGSLREGCLSGRLLFSGVCQARVALKGVNCDVGEAGVAFSESLFEMGYL